MLYVCVWIDAYVYVHVDIYVLCTIIYCQWYGCVRMYVCACMHVMFAYILYVCMWVLLHATYFTPVQHVPKVPFWSQVSVHTSSVQIWCQVGAYCFLFLVTRSSVSFPCHFVISVSPLLLCSHCHSLVTLLSVSVSVPCHSVVSVSALPLCP